VTSTKSNHRHPRATPPRDEPDLGLVDALVQLSFAVLAALGSVAAAHDLSVIQLRLLGVLRDREPAMLDLAHALNLEKSSVTGLVDRAQARGLVERFGAEHDGRAVQVRLTALGHDLATELTGHVTRHVAELAEGLPQRDRARLARLASRVVVDDAARRGIDLQAGMAGPR
jgi:DNA-binding MarR family transcriptional regulator